MQYQQTPQGLAQIFSAPPEAQPAMMGLLGQQQNADQMVGQDQARQLAYDTAADPGKLAKLDWENKTAEAELPGKVANSNIAVRKNQAGAATYDADIKDVLGKHGADATKRYVDDVQNMGQVALYAAQEYTKNPIGMAARAKDMFTQAGHGADWQDSWDKLPPEQLAQTLTKYGNGVQEHAAAYSKALMQANARADAMRDVANINYNRGVDVQSMKSATAAAKAAQSHGETMSQYEARIRVAASDSNPDPDAKAAAQAQLALLEQQKQQKAAAGSTVTQGGAVDLTKPPFNMKTRGGEGGDLSKGKTPPPAQAKEDWIKRAMQANPDMSREQIEAEGKSRGKF